MDTNGIYIGLKLRNGRFHKMEFLSIDLLFLPRFKLQAACIEKFFLDDGFKKMSNNYKQLLIRLNEFPLLSFKWFYKNPGETVTAMSYRREIVRKV